MQPAIDDDRGSAGLVVAVQTVMAILRGINLDKAAGFVPRRVELLFTDESLRGLPFVLFDLDKVEQKAREFRPLLQGREPTQGSIIAFFRYYSEEVSQPPINLVAPNTSASDDRGKHLRLIS